MQPGSIRGEDRSSNPHIAHLNWGLLTLSMISLLTACLLVFYILGIYNTAPIIFSDDDGYIENRQVMVFEIDENRIKAYLNLVLPRLLDCTPGIYDIQDLEPLVDPGVINNYREYFSKSLRQRINSSERHWFEITDLRRLPVADTPQIVAIVRGQLSIYRAAQETQGSADNSFYAQTGYVKSQPITYLVYLNVDTPTEDNPWGLFVTKVNPMVKREMADKYWEDSKPFFQTAYNGETIRKFQRDSLPKTTQAKRPRNPITTAPGNP